MEENCIEANEANLSIENEHNFFSTAPADLVTEKFSYHQEMSKVEELSRVLKDTQQRLNAASMRSHLLNVDIVTQFNPHQEDRLHKIIMDCESCIERMKEREQKMVQMLSPKTH